MRDLADRAWTPILLCVVVVAAALIGSLGSSSVDGVVVLALINLVLVLGLHMFVGTSGVFSFGHMGFMAIGAYAGAVLVLPIEVRTLLLPTMPGFATGLHLATVPAILVAAGLAGAFAALLAVPLMRLSGLTAGLATFALLIVLHVVARSWQGLTGGTGGMTGIKTTTTLGAALVWSLLALWCAWFFQQSRFGLRLRASREDEWAARALGVRVTRERSIAFALSAFVCGVGGALFALYIGSFNPDAFYLSITILTSAMLVIGGLGSLSGAVLGVLVISVIQELLRRIEEGTTVLGLHLHAPPGLREVGLAVFMLAILVLRPRGLSNGREIRWPLRRSWSARTRARQVASGDAPAASQEPAASGRPS